MDRNIQALKSKKTYRNGLLLAIEYLRGEIDIYDQDEGCYWAVEVWDDAWDEMTFIGYTPDSVEGIKQYIANELG